MSTDEKKAEPQPEQAPSVEQVMSGLNKVRNMGVKANDMGLRGGGMLGPRKLGPRKDGLVEPPRPIKNDPGVEDFSSDPALKGIRGTPYEFKPFPAFDPYVVSPAALIGLVIETNNGMLIQVAAASADPTVTELTTLIGSASYASIPWLFSDVVALRTPYSPVPPYGGEIIWRRPHVQ